MYSRYQVLYQVLQSFVVLRQIRFINLHKILSKNNQFYRTIKLKKFDYLLFKFQLNHTSTYDIILYYDEQVFTFSYCYLRS